MPKENNKEKAPTALLEVFTVEVVERSAIMYDGEPGTNFQAVCEVTKDWIREQIEKL